MSQRVLGYLLRAKHCRDLADGNLLERFCATREEAAFGLLLQRHGPMVFAVCRRILHNLHDAEDAFQATFLVLVRKARSIRRRASLGSWLHGVARRVAMRAKEQAAARRQRDQQACPAKSADPFDCLIEQELLALLDDQIRRLPARYRDPVVLCYLERKTYEQAASELGWPKSTLASRLDQALRLLHQRLRRRGVSVPAGLAGTMLMTETVRAHVPAVLMLNVVRAATQTITGATATATAISPQVTGLADSAVAALLASKLKVVLVFTLLLATTGGAVLAHLVATGKGTPNELAQAPAQAPATKLETARDRQQKTDLYGDPLPAGAIVRLGTERYRGVPRNWLAAFDAAGKTYVAEGDGAAILSEIETGRVLRRFPMPGRVYAAALSPDGKTVAAGGGPTDDLVRVWDAATGRDLRQFKASVGGYGQVLLFTPDGTKLARYDGNSNSYLWDLRTGKEIWSHKEPDRRCILSPRVFSADGKILFAIEDRARQDAVVLIETASGRELRRIKGVMPDWALAFSHDRKILASIGANFALHFRDVATGEKLCDVHGLRNTGEQLAFSPDGKTLACSSGDNCIRLIDVASGKEMRQAAKGLGFARHLTFLGDDKTIAFCFWNEDTLRVWDLELDREIHPSGGHRGRIYEALFYPDGKTLISASMDNTIRYWDLARGKELHRIDAHTGGVWALAMSPNGEALASSGLNDAGIRLWDTVDRKEIRRLAVQEGAQALTFTPDGKRLLSASPAEKVSKTNMRNYRLRLWDIATGTELRQWDTQSNHCPLALSHDGKSVASENAGFIVVWDVLTGRTLRRLPIRASNPWVNIGDLAFSPNDRMMVCERKDPSYKDPQSAITFWELASGKERLSIRLAPEPGKTLSFTTDGKYLAVGGDDHRVHLIDTDTGETIRRLEGHHGFLRTVTFAPDGKTLATGSADTTILIWNVDDLQRPAHKPSKKLSAEDMAAMWNDLAGADAAKAYRAIVTMSTASQTVPYLAQRLKPVAPVDPALLARLLSDLDSANYGAREKAAAELAKLGDLAEQTLQAALAKKPSLEFQRRVEAILRKPDEPVTSSEMLRTLRALEVLERIGSSEAHKVLATMAAGAPSSRVTQAAQAALQRHAQASSSLRAH
jgi:RNA polymerase sigma factor (sigma-70 family)